MASDFFKFIIASTFLALGLVSCQWQSNQTPNVLVIVIDRLGFEKVSCDSDEMSLREFEGFRSFCEEGVRFTHAYSTSTLGQAAMTSILTGLYPIEHGVRHNGMNRLPARINTLAEAAIRGGYRTALFSGGPPILRKSGISQGFEIFDDHFPINGPDYYRPSQEIFRTFLNWRNRAASHEPFFGVLFLSDLQFPTAATRSDQGELRERTGESQLREVAESLTELVHEMKAQKIWHRTHVVLVGLTGSGGSAHSEEIEPLGLFSEDTQVAMFIKPARRSVDGGPQWTVDKNVSLADLGFSLYEFVGADSPKIEIEQLPRVSLFGLQSQALSDWDDDRMILIESAWGKWRNLSEVRMAARKRQYLYIHDSPPRLYNTLIDRMEVAPLSSKDPLWTSMDDSILWFFNERNIEPFEIIDSEYFAQLIESIKWWQTGMATDPPPKFQTTQARTWLAERYLDMSSWPELLKLGEESKERIYTYVAQKNLNVSAKLPTSYCGRFFDRKVWSSLKSQADIVEKCEDRLFKIALEASFGNEPEVRERALDILGKRYQELGIDRRLGAANYSRDLVWDVSLGLPTGATFGDLFMGLPENRFLRDQISNRQLREDSAFEL